MRIVHTSDWHLGQTFYHFDRTYEHQCFLDWLIDRLESLQADVLLISGDIFDNANPSAAAQKQLYRFFQTANERLPYLNIVGIAGNHDSPARLEVTEPLLERYGVRMIGHVARLSSGEIDLDRLLIPLKDQQGQIKAWCLAVPFLRPGDVPLVETGQDAYPAGVAKLYEQMFERALSKRESHQAIVALGHCHMVGGEVSEETERRIVIGGQEALPSGLFDERIAYVALGHLHLAQRVGQQERLRYSGSPLPMSFSEVHYPHQIVCFDLEGERLSSIEPVSIPRFVELLRVPEKALPWPEVLDAIQAIDLQDLEDELKPYLEVRIKLDRPEPGLRHAIDTALKDKPVRLAKIETRYAKKTEDALESISEGLNGLQPEHIFRKIYSQKYGSDVEDPLLQAFNELLIASNQMESA